MNRRQIVSVVQYRQAQYASPDRGFPHHVGLSEPWEELSLEPNILLRSTH